MEIKGVIKEVQRMSPGEMVRRQVNTEKQLPKTKYKSCMGVCQQWSMATVHSQSWFLRAWTFLESMLPSSSITSFWKSTSVLQGSCGSMHTLSRTTWQQLTQRCPDPAVPVGLPKQSLCPLVYWWHHVWHQFDTTHHCLLSGSLDEKIIFFLQSVQS